VIRAANKPKYEEEMFMDDKILELEDVSIEQIEISKSGIHVTIRFIDMHKGQPCAVIKCEYLYIFDYHCALEEDDFPGYIGNVDHVVLSGQEIKNTLDALNFRFGVSENPVKPLENIKQYIPESESLHFLDIEGGEISIRILCRSVVVEKFN
jgi:hypothetical protein